MDLPPGQPYLTFLRETTAFHSANAYLLVAHVAALQDADTPVVTAHAELTRHVAPTYKDPRSYFVARLFIAHIAAFENFLQETVTVVVHRHPKKVGAVEFRLAEVLDAVDSRELVQRATEETLNRLLYKKPQEYLRELCALLSIEHSPLGLKWKIFVEAKARRDLGVHSAWKCNAVYLRKIAEVGLNTTLAVGDSSVPQDSSYLESVVKALDDLAYEVSEAVFTKHWPALLPLPKRDA